MESCYVLIIQFYENFALNNKVLLFLQNLSSNNYQRISSSMEVGSGSDGRSMLRSESKSFNFGDNPPCMHKIFPAMQAAYGR